MIYPNNFNFYVNKSIVKFQMSLPLPNKFKYLMFLLNIFFAEKKPHFFNITITSAFSTENLMP